MKSFLTSESTRMRFAQEHYQNLIREANVSTSSSWSLAYTAATAAVDDDDDGWWCSGVVPGSCSYTQVYGTSVDVSKQSHGAEQCHDICSRFHPRRRTTSSGYYTTTATSLSYWCCTCTNYIIIIIIIVIIVIRQNCFCSASDSTYFYTFIHSITFVPLFFNC